MAFLLEVSTTTVADMSSTLDVLGSVYTFLVGQISDIVNLIMTQPLLLIPIGITIGYVIFRFFRMIFRLA